MNISLSSATSRDGTKIAYDRLGDGPVVILVGGATQHRAVDQTTATLAQRLAEAGHSVVHYDRRGRGDSTNTLPYETAREIEDLDALVDDVGGEASVFAMSSGAVLAVEAAAHGVALSRLALYEPPLILPGTGPQIPDSYVERLDALLAEDRRRDALALFMVGAAGLTPDDFEELTESPIFPAFEAIAHTLAYDGRFVEQATAGGRLPERWRRVTQPALVIEGGDSPSFMRDAAKGVAEVLPNGRRRSLDGQTHAYDVDVLAPVLTSWFATDDD